METTNQTANSPSKSRERFGVFATSFIKENTLLGEYNGFLNVVNKNDKKSNNQNANKVIYKTKLFY